MTSSHSSGQSSTATSGGVFGGPQTGAASALAYEGRGTQQCSVTVAEATPWWEVDLGAVHEVQSLVIISSLKAKNSFAAGVDVFLDGTKCSSNANVSMVNFKQESGKNWPRMHRTTCVGAGRVVRIQLKADAGAPSPQQLVLCTVQVEKGDPTNAIKHAQKLFLASSELHATSLNRPKPTARLDKLPQVAYGRPYKAVVIMLLLGGCDSYSLLVPHSKCKDIVDPTSESGEKKVPFDLYDEYATVRGPVVALPKAKLLPIEVPKESNQPCDTFGVHPSLPFLQTLYNDGDATFLANVGTLVEPITKAEVTARGGPTKKVPNNLFSHNSQQK